MKESKHTPGPWVAEPEEASDHRGIAICAPGNGWIVATITPEDDRQADEIDWANARIIAAAPLMLEELKYVVDGLLHIQTPWAKERLRFVREVIAQVEGEL